VRHAHTYSIFSKKTHTHTRVYPDSCRPIAHCMQHTHTHAHTLIHTLVLVDFQQALAGHPIPISVPMHDLPVPALVELAVCECIYVCE
jgi:hypothetical protein